MAMTAGIGKTIINTKGLRRFQREINASLRSTSHGPMLDVRKKWAERYRGEMKNRYTKFSRGGGNWEKLKPATIAARRHGKGGGHKRGKRAHEKAKASGGGRVSILWDLGQLIGALSPKFSRLPGQFQRAIAFGILVGFGGSAGKKNKDGSKSPKTVAEIADIHQEGKGNNPQRKILVDPSPRLMDLMAGDMLKGLKKIIKESQVRPA